MAIRTVGFTGHRSVEGDIAWAREALLAAVERSFDAGATNFICGGAPGTDIMFIDTVVTICEKRGMKGLPDILVAAAIPFPSFWDFYNRDGKSYIIDVADLREKVGVIVSVNDDPYEVWKLHARNHWIVDQSDVMMSIYDGRKVGGTYKTLSYARRNGKKVYWIDPVSKTEKWVSAQ